MTSGFAPAGATVRAQDRPAHSGAADAVVLTVDRGRFRCEVTDAEPPVAVSAMRARELGRTRIVVGDRVRLSGDVSGTDGTLARIVAIAERSSLLMRSADDATNAERPLVANADQLGIVVARRIRHLGPVSWIAAWSLPTTQGSSRC